MPFVRFFYLSTFLLTCLMAGSLSAQTIAEKKQGLQKGSGADLDRETQALLTKVNQELTEYKLELKELYAEVMVLHQQHASPARFQSLLQQINEVRAKIIAIENQWRETATTNAMSESYALWHQPDTNLEQLVIDYGSQDYVYLMTPEIGARKISISSNLPVPRAAWSEMLEVILAQNGVGIRQINPFLRELYLLKDNSANLNYITNRRQDLELLPREARIAFVLSPDPADVRRIWLFLDKFANPNSTVLQLIGRDILIVAQVGEIQDLMKLYDFISTNKGTKDYKLVALSKVRAEEMAKILAAVFDHMGAEVPGEPTKEGEAPRRGTDKLAAISEANGLKVIVLKSLSQALFLIGTREEINKAEQMIHDVESQIGGRREKTIYWYTVKYSDPEELADLLERIYLVMVQELTYQTQAVPGQKDQQAITQNVDVNPVPGPPPKRTQKQIYAESFYQAGDVVVNPSIVTLAGYDKKKRKRDDRANFIVDSKTGSIVMVVEQDILPKLQETLRRLDVPKKMVRIDVLLFEKKISDNTNYGLNLLKIGSCASQTNESCVSFNDLIKSGGIAGITSFMFSRAKDGHTPAFDLTYNFLLSQTDIMINSNPTVTTVNQTPAQVAIVEEFSINTGTYDVETTGAVTLKQAFTRAQYGVTMEITPTIHLGNDDDMYGDSPNLITLETDVAFDTVQGNPTTQDDRPPVTRRKITNEVVLGDGQTLILGGLRRKNTGDEKESVPFLGEIPGLGKLFSTTTLVDQTTEMFIFITPTIIADPCEDIERIKLEEMMRRPGDVPDFMMMLNESRKLERGRLFSQTLKILLGREQDEYFETQVGCWPDSYAEAWMETPWCACGEYDGS